MSKFGDLIKLRKFNWLPEIVMLIILALLPLKYGTQAYTMGLLTLLMIYTILLIGLDITVGYLGQINLGQTAFLAIGAYSSGIISGSFDLDILSCLIISFIFAFFFGILIAIPALQLTGPQFALVTLTFTTLTATVLNELEWLTGGAQGLSLHRPHLFGFNLGAPGFYWLCLAVMVFVWLGMHNFLKSQWGRSFQALNDSTIATDAVGIGAMRHKIIAFAIGSAIGGLAGGLYAFNLQYLQPLSFTYELMVILLLGVVLGGRKSLWGAFIGAALVTLLPNLLSNQTVFRTLATLLFLFALIDLILKVRQGKKLGFISLAPFIALSLLFVGSFFMKNPEDWRKGIFAIILFSAVVGLPEGLMGFIERQIQNIFKLPPPPLPAAASLDIVLPVLNITNPKFLEVEDLKCHFGGIKAVDGVSFHLTPKKIFGIIGPNGSGKTTLINIISGFYKPSSGKIIFESQELPTGSLLKVSRHRIARTFQNLQLFTELTALENVMAALRGAYKKPWFLIMAGLGGNEEEVAREKAFALLEYLGLSDYSLILAKNLPYGVQRFLEIARALATQPHLLILDEPAAGMSKPDADKLKKVIAKIRQRGITIILIEHRMDIITELCDEVVVLERGQIIAQGTAQEIKKDPAVIQAYLGDPAKNSLERANKLSRKSENVTAALSVKDLTAGYGLGNILNGLSIEVEKGEIVAMIGANGVGKTTSMRAISGLLPVTSGKVTLWGKDITNLPAYKVVLQHLSHTPEGRGVFGDLTVEDNLLLGGYIHLPGFFGYMQKAESDLDAMYQKFPALHNRRKRLAGTLSGGEQQMLAIARSLMSKPQILLLDEPSMGLSPIIVENVFKIIRELNEQGISILLVEQFAAMALNTADYVYVIEHGHVVFEGSAEDVSKNPKVLSAYLGD